MTSMTRSVAGIGVAVGAALGTLLIAAGPAAATTSGASSASVASDGVIVNWYQTYHECLTDGNTYAQQGMINYYECAPSEGGFVLNGRKF